MPDPNARLRCAQEVRLMTVPDASQAQLTDPDPAGQPIGQVKASDADRERTVDLLSRAFAEGRLTAEEHDARVGQAYRARTYADLAAVSADLPDGRPAAGPAHRSGGPAAGSAAAADRRTSPLAVAALVCGVIPGITHLAAIILGVVALRRIRRTGERGALLAAAGMVLGALGLVLTVLLVL